MNIDQKLDGLFDAIDTLCHAGCFAGIDVILEASIACADMDLRLGLLTTTLCCKDELKWRSLFFQITALCATLRNDPKELLEGLA